MDIITGLITGAVSVVTSFGGVLSESVGAVTDIFWDSTASELTIVGAGMAMALGIGAVYLLFRLIRGLIKTNERG